MVCPGQGSADFQLVAELAAIDARLQPVVAELDGRCRERFSLSFTEYCRNPEQPVTAEAAFCYQQLAIYLGAVACGQRLLADGCKPDCVIGHSVGEIAALALGEAISVEEGLEAVRRRAEVILDAIPQTAGRMLAVEASRERAIELIDGVPEVYIAVVNHDRQAVLAGAGGKLNEVEAQARRADFAQ